MAKRIRKAPIFVFVIAYVEINNRYVCDMPRTLRESYDRYMFATLEHVPSMATCGHPRNPLFGVRGIMQVSVVNVGQAPGPYGGPSQHSTIHIVCKYLKCVYASRHFYTLDRIAPRRPPSLNYQCGPVVAHYFQTRPHNAQIP